MKKIAGFLFSPQLMAVVLSVFAVSIGIATFIENDFGTPTARSLVYNARWFELLLLLGAINMTGRIVTRKLYERRKFPVFLFHVSFLIILAGAAVTRYTGWEGTISIREGESANKVLIGKMSDDSLYRELPFELRLTDFIIERYPGSRSPSSFESRVTLTDNSHNYVSDHRIYMNNILKYKGYRFYQASYYPDEKGTILSVNRDPIGNFITYTGYILMGLGMILSLFSRQSRFRWLSDDNRRLKALRNALPVLLLLFLSCFTVIAQKQDHQPGIVTINANHARSFGRLLVQDNNGRIKPVNTLSSEVLRKLIRKNTYKGMNPDQVFLGMFTKPSEWQYEPLIRVPDRKIRELTGSSGKYHSFASFFRNETYILMDHVARAYRKKPASRSKFDNEIIRVDERINICYMALSGEFLRIFPLPGDSTQAWYNQLSIRDKNIPHSDAMFVSNIIHLYSLEVTESLESGNWERPDELIAALISYQKKYAPDIIPSDSKISAEIFLNRFDLFSAISKYYGLIGFVLLVLQFAGLFYPGLKLKIPVTISMILIIFIFCVHSTGLVLRWFVAGHAPLTNGYEALTYVAWATVLAGLVFSSKSSVTLSVTSILAFLILFVAHLSWMDPQITNLVPVLKSRWLVIHVATVTASYGFLGMGALLAFIVLIMMIIHTGKNRKSVGYAIQEITNTIEMSLTIGLYLLTTGVFLGAVWANESWGRYWGWDPKETWALITVLVYAFILHMRMISGLKGAYAFNLASLVGFSSVIMTYFGVNYYLSGMHSYAQGDPIPVPAFVYYTIAVVVVTTVAAYYRSNKLINNEEMKE